LAADIISGSESVAQPVPVKTLNSPVSPVSSVSSVRTFPFRLDHENDLPATQLLSKLSSVGGGSLVKRYLGSNERFEVT
jgi:hypothetical protein